MTDEVEEVKDPQALLTAYNKLKADMQTLTAERESLKAQVAELGDDKFRLKALTAETKLALQAQGVKDADRLIGYVGTDGLDFDDKGNLTGLEDRMDKLKKDLPEVFDVKRRAGGRADIHADGDVEIKRDPLREAVHAAMNK